jgi:hypothetical protein
VPGARDQGDEQVEGPGRERHGFAVTQELPFARVEPVRTEDVQTVRLQ